jgi:hypothetical protein
MDFPLTTPSLLFPAISLLLLAYTNRFLALASLIRQLHGDYERAGEGRVLEQIRNIRWRLQLIRVMQALGVLSLLVCTVCMFFAFAGWTWTAAALFALSLLLMSGSLACSVWEIHISTGALNILLRDLEAKQGERLS